MQNQSVKTIKFSKQNADLLPKLQKVYEQKYSKKFASLNAWLEDVLLQLTKNK